MTSKNVRVFATKLTGPRVEIEHDLGVEIEIGDLRIEVTAGENGNNTVCIRGKGPLAIRLGSSNSFEVAKA